MSELQDMLRVQARLHRKQGANALGQLFESAIEEIQLLNKNYNQLFDAFQNCHDELVDANERVKELEQENKEFTMLIANLVRRADVKIDLLQNPTYEKASEQLNKFAIEQRQEAVEEYKKSDEFCKLLDSHFNSGKVYGHNEYYEQLRKEQAHG